MKALADKVIKTIGEEWKGVETISLGFKKYKI